jgi:hypothetical protein
MPETFIRYTLTVDVPIAATRHCGTVSEALDTAALTMAGLGEDGVTVTQTQAPYRKLGERPPKPSTVAAIGAAVKDGAKARKEAAE